MRPLIYSLLLLFIVNFSANATNTLVELDKVVEKSFPITADGTFEVKNKYGSIDITTWDQNRIDIKVTISVKTRSQDRADEIFDRIEIDFVDTNDFVSAVTEIESKSRSWFSWGSTNDTDFEINYEVQMPASVHLKCENKFGSTYIADLNNGIELVMKYGDVRMGSVEGEMSLDLGFGKIDFGDVGDLKAVIKHSSMKGSSTQDMDIDSKHSNVQIGDARNFKANSKHDSYVIGKAKKINNYGKFDSWEIGEVDELDMESGHNSIRIGRLLGDLKLDQGFGSLEVVQVACIDAVLDINVEHTSVKLNTEECADLEIDFYGEHISTNFSGNLTNLVNVDGSSKTLNERIGNGNLKIKLEMRHGSLKIK